MGSNRPSHREQLAKNVQQNGNGNNPGKSTLKDRRYEALVKIDGQCPPLPPQIIGLVGARTGRKCASYVTQTGLN